MKKLVALLTVATFLFVTGDAIAKKHHKKHKKAKTKIEKTEAPAPTPTPTPTPAH